MHNLKYFCHYHHGKPHERAIKVIGSLLIVTMAYVWGASTQVIAASESQAYLLGNLIPEPPAIHIAQTDGSSGGGGYGGYPPNSGGSGTSGGYPMYGDGSQPQNRNGGHQGGYSKYGNDGGYPGGGYQDGQPTGPSFDDGGEEDMEKRETERILREAKHVLRELKGRMREVNRICKQLKRLKDMQTDVSECDTIATQLSDLQTRLGLTDADSVAEAIDEFRDLDIHETLEALRYKAELPKHLNRLFKELNSLNRALTNKGLQKYFDTSAFAATVAGWMEGYSVAKQAFADGDYETAREFLENFRESSPGMCMGALGSLRGIKTRLARVEDESLRQELDALLAEPIQLLNDGECRVAMESLRAVEGELGSLLDQDFEDEGLSDEFMDKIMKLRERLEGGM